MRTWLKEIRELKGYTQAEVAEGADIKRSTYGHIESGIRGATVPNAKKIANFLEFDWTIFFEK